MSEKQPANFNPDIHSVRYADEYRARRIGHESIITEGNRRVESLDGAWRFSVDQYDTFLRAKWFREGKSDSHGIPRPPDYDFEHWEEVTVPSCWNMADDSWFNYEGSAVYTRTFRYLPRKENERVFLKFGAANYEAFVFLNKEPVGVHRGGSTPFFVEITPLLGPENRLSVVVNNRRESDQVPMDNSDWFNYGGLYRSVELIRVPQTFVRRFSVALVPGSGFKKIRAYAEVDGPEQSGKVVLRIAEIGVEESIPLSSGKGTVEFAASPELWSPESPKLYEVELSLGKDDRVRERIGFREIAVDGLGLRLNGRPVYLKGVSYHEDSLENGKAVSREEVEQMFEVAADLGCNFIRLAHYPHAEMVARIADEKGFLLWEEIPVYWAIDFANSRTYDDAANQLSELVLRDANRASVVLWSVGNENPDTDERLDFMKRLADRARELDATRLVTAACLWNRETNRIDDRLAGHLDVIGINEYFGWYEGDFEVLVDLFHGSKPTKPVIVSEFGAGALAGHYGTVDDLFSENMQRRIYEQQIDVIGNAPYVAGMTPWILFDFRCPRRLNGFQAGFNRKGLVAADRVTRKLAFATLKAFYASRH
jgi:beta-glucuronidase